MGKGKWAALVLAGASLLTSVKVYEGRSNTVYLDVVGVPTYCDGITYPKPIPGKVYSNAECDALLLKNVASHGEAFLQCVTVPLNQNQYDAFTSLAYNIGPARICTSGLKLKPPVEFLIDKLNKGDYTAACQRILAYNKAGGKVYRGLTNRRIKESQLCLTPAPAKAPAALVQDAPAKPEIVAAE